MTAINWNTTQVRSQIARPIGRILKLAALSLGASLLLSAAPAPAAIPDRPTEFDSVAVGKFLLLDFYTPYCGTCQMMQPYVQALGAKNEAKLTIKHVDISQGPNRKYIATYSITGTPTYVLFNPAGKAVYKMEDMISPKILEKNVLQQIQGDVTEAPNPAKVSQKSE